MSFLIYINGPEIRRDHYVVPDGYLSTEGKLTGWKEEARRFATKSEAEEYIAEQGWVNSPSVQMVRVSAYVVRG